MAAHPVWLPTRAPADDPFVGALRASLSADVVLVTDEVLPAGFAPRTLVRGVPSEAQLAACPGLERVVIPYAGVPPRTAALLRERPEIAVHNLHHNAASTAELAVALLLACTKAIVPYDADLRRGDWRRRYAEPTAITLEGKSATVLGYGAIGGRVGRALRALGMRVTAVRRRPLRASVPEDVAVVGADGLDALLPRTEALVLCLPLTEATRGLLDARRLALLPASAFLVNVGRGELVDEDALYAALAGGGLAGAGLDVWYRYPTSEAERAATSPSAHPFGALENVVLSPHRAGLTRQNEAARAAALAELLGAAARGGTVPHRVDLDRGY